MEPAELEFLAEDQFVEIIPKFDYKKIFLISGEIGPFRPGIPLKVPIWLAANLKARQKCKIVPPEWMNVETLEELRKEEIGSKFFCPVPSEYYVIEAQILLRIAEDDIHRADAIRTIVKDIWDNRLAKYRSSVDRFFNTGGSHATVDNLTSVEINSLRPVVPYALDLLNRLRGYGSSVVGSASLRSGDVSSPMSGSRSFSSSHFSSQS